MFTHLLVSFSNAFPGAPTLGLLNLATGGVQVLRVPPQLSAAGGATGLAVSNRHLYVVTQRAAETSVEPNARVPSSLFVFNRKDLSLACEHTCSSVFDAHSIIARDNVIDVVSTGTDEIVRLRFDGRAITSEVPLWHAEPGGPKIDRHHLNSLCLWRGELLVSGFGQREAIFWRTAARGFIDRVSDRERLVADVQQPHSLTVRGDRLFYCESATQSIRELGGDAHATVNGYTRGMCAVGDYLYIATSKGRRKSRTTGLLTTHADPGVSAGRCSVVKIRSSDFLVEQTIPLDLLAWEIYDVCPVEDIELWPVLDDEEWRTNLIAAFWEAYGQKDADVAWLHTEVAARDELVAALQRELAERS